jgi:predicted GIY-YIG superfamily endonuclease
MSVQDYDFKNAKIYKILDNTTNMIYVGSTCYSLENRIKNHESSYKTYQRGKKANNLTSYRILKNGNYKIELIENFPCENSKQLFQREGYYIRKYKSEGLNVVNKTILGVKSKDKFNCDCGGRYTGGTKSQHQYTQKHKKYIDNRPKVVIPGNNNNITINIFCQSKDDIDLIELEREFQEAIN